MEWKRWIYFHFVFLIQLFIESYCENVLDYNACGIIPSKFEHIVGGDDKTGDWPWMASFGLEGEDKKWLHRCGATLIDNHQFITAAHCIRDSEPSWKIKTGISKLNSDGPERAPSIILDIESKIQHPRYDETAYFDIGIIKTQTVEFHRFLRPVCLPKEPNPDPDKYKNYKLTITGWGATNSKGNPSNELRRVEVTVFPKTRCNRIHQPFLTVNKKVMEFIPRLFEDQLMCAGDTLEEKGSCRGDSGGPLMFLDTEGDEDIYVQVGTVQGSIGSCGDRNVPSIFVRLDDALIFEFLNSSRTVLQIINYDAGDDRGRLKYEGSVQNKVPSGHGTMMYNDGSKYVGQWSNGQKQGQGTFYYSKEDAYKRSKYVGSWQNDEINGFGTMTWTNGETYEGGWLNGLRHGKGKDVFSKESPDLSYEGDWVEDKYSGKGVYIWKDGHKYEGDYLNDLKHGKGKLVYSNESPGLSYEGDWVEGEKSGKGVYIWKDGEKYEGDWLNDLRHGKGKRIFSDESSALSYEGDWVEDKRSGKGVYIWKDGEKYEGDFLNDSRHGNGIQTSASGEILHQGKWENGKFVD